MSNVGNIMNSSMIDLDDYDLGDDHCVEVEGGSVSQRKKPKVKGIMNIRALGANAPIRVTRASNVARDDGSGPSRSDKGKKRALYDEDDEIKEDIEVVDDKGDEPAFGSYDDMINID
ncbi:hypothetical protein L1987_19028 [Smallanthus sonchifolius]|uniref:Uncharacterized protein n=1 Tax=Smallanthus sonchifolius TaxID=185202 RepID=A0ACB9J2D4_9ASTR|nr:hypothetical protein L1987_19028 [Smallanthus sonchifolius]